MVGQGLIPLAASVYLLIATVLSVYTTRWHADRGSPTWHMIHDILVSLVWPAVVVERIRAARR